MKNLNHQGLKAVFLVTDRPHDYYDSPRGIFRPMAVFGSSIDARQNDRWYHGLPRFAKKAILAVTGDRI